MKIPKHAGLHSPFFGNYYCIIPNTNFAFLVISKNACSFLKRVAIYNERGDWVQGHDEIHNLIGYNNQSKYLYSTDDILKVKKRSSNLKLFCVWRDPVDRLVSTYKHFILERSYRNYFNWMGFYNRDISFKEFLKFSRFELDKLDPVFQDEHIRKQIDYLETEPDYIVHIKSLFKFLDANEINYVKERSNKTKVRFQLSNEIMLKQIQKLYKEDYLININYK